MDRRVFLLASGGWCGLRGHAREVPAVVPGLARQAWQTRWQRVLQELEQQSGGRLGVSMRDTGSGWSLGWRPEERVALCSTFKLLLAGWMLSLVDRGQASIDQRMAFAKSELMAYSPITRAHADRDGMTLAQLCEAAVAWSDNTAANVLLRRFGGPSALTAFLRQIGDAVTRLDRCEPDLNQVTPGSIRDTTSPESMLLSTEKLVLGDVLEPELQAYLRRWLCNSHTGDKRLRAGAPGWQVGDKTGTHASGGLASDVAVLWPPQGHAAPVLIAAYVAAPKLQSDGCDALLAQVARVLLAARAEVRAA